MAPGGIALAIGIGLLPVLVLLAVLTVMDSFRLVSGRRLLAALGAGGLAAVAASLVSWGLLELVRMPIDSVARYVSPALEELVKAVYPLLLIRRRRIGFTVDAAIVGFAVGAGFAVVENAYYALAFAELPTTIWLVRGFGTGIMHGACSAVFAMLALAAHLRIGLPAASGLVERLVEAGHLERNPDTHDRRQQLLTLTEQGRELVDRFHELPAEKLGELIANLSLEELRGLRAGVAAIEREARRIADDTLQTPDTERTPA